VVTIAAMALRDIEPEDDRSSCTTHQRGAAVVRARNDSSALAARHPLDQRGGDLYLGRLRLGDL
jgi:hypothetical protein